MPPTRPVRVLHVVARLSPDGGVPIVVRGLLANLDPARVEAHVVTVRPPYEEDRLDLVGAPVHPLGIGPRRYRIRDRWRIAAGVASTAASLAPDVVHVHSGTAWFSVAARARLPRTTFVLEVHDAPGSGRHGRWSDLLEGVWVRRLGAHAVCHSASVCDDVRRRWRPPSDRVVRFPLGVDPNSFAPAVRSPVDSGDAAGRSTTARRLIVVGRLVPSKRVDLAIDALARIAERGIDAELLVVGQGALQADLEARVADLDLADKVRFVGRMTGDELVAAVASADVLLSTSEYEGFGLTVVEAMACGVPVVAMRAGGVAELLTHGGGMVVDAGDVAALADRVAELLGDDDLRRRVGAEGRRTVEEHYSNDTVAERFTELYERLGARSVARSR